MSRKSQKIFAGCTNLSSVTKMENLKLMGIRRIRNWEHTGNTGSSHEQSFGNSVQGRPQTAGTNSTTNSSESDSQNSTVSQAAPGNFLTPHHRAVGGNDDEVDHLMSGIVLKDLDSVSEGVYYKVPGHDDRGGDNLLLIWKFGRDLVSLQSSAIDAAVQPLLLGTELNASIMKRSPIW
jgi:hypothetical protein